MKLHFTQAAGQNLFTGYGDDYVAINNERYAYPVLVSPARPVARWEVTTFDALTPAHFAAIVELSPEIVVLGTGKRLQFPRPELTRAVWGSQIGFEVMDTKAACRTYNILMAEGRQVVAAILI